MARRRSVPAGAPVAALAALAIAAAATPAAAAPKTVRAKVAFDRGVKAYQRGDYAAAAAAFGESLDAESDTETMFALAQAERQLGKCETAIGLYDQLLAGELPPANQAAIQKAKAECREILANERRAAGAGGSGGSGSSGGNATGSDDGPDTDADPNGTATLVLEPRVAHVWWREPVGDVLAGFGLVGLGLGAGFFLESQNALDAQNTAMTDSEFRHEQARASTDHDASVIASVAGSVLLAGGVAWYVTHHGDEPRHAHHPRAVTGWLDAGGGGLTVLGTW